MLKRILNLEKAKTLSKKQQQQINGGSVPSCWIVCPQFAPILCGVNTGLYTAACDCNC